MLQLVMSGLTLVIMVFILVMLVRVSKKNREMSDALMQTDTVLEEQLLTQQQIIGDLAMKLETYKKRLDAME